MFIILNIKSKNPENDVLEGLSPYLDIVIDVKLFGELTVSDMFKAGPSTEKNIEFLLNRTWHVDDRLSMPQGCGFVIPTFNYATIMAVAFANSTRLMYVSETNVITLETTNTFGFYGEVPELLELLDNLNVTVTKIIKAQNDTGEDITASINILNDKHNPFNQKKFRNIDHLIMNMRIQQFHQLLLDDVDVDKLVKKYDDVTYSLTNEFGYGGVAVDHGDIDTITMLKYDNWLVDTFDSDHVKLTRCMNSAYGYNLEHMDLTISEFVNTLTDFHIWLKDKYPKPTDTIDLSNCPVMYVVRIIDSLKSVSYDKLQNRVKYLDSALNLYRYPDSSGIDLCLHFDDVPFISFDRTSVGIKLSKSCYDGGADAHSLSLHRSISADPYEMNFIHLEHACQILLLIGAVRHIQHKNYIS